MNVATVEGLLRLRDEMSAVIEKNVAALKDLDRMLANLGPSAKTAQSSLNNVAASAKAAGTNVAGAASATTASFRAIGQSATSMANVVAPQASRVVASVSAIASALNLSQVQKQMAGVGVALTAGITVPFAMAALASTQAAMAFETNMTRIETLVGVSRETVESWKDSVRGMARDVGVGPAKLAEGLYFVTGAGLRGAESLEVLKAAAQASAIGLGEVSTISRTVVAAMEAWGKSGMTATQATEVLVGTVREGNLVASEVAGTFGRVMAIAATMGVSFQEVGAFVAAFSRQGVNAAEAVTSLRGVLSLLMHNSRQSAKTLAEVGLSADQLRAIIKEKGLLAALTTLYDTFDQAGKVERLGDAVPNVRALAGFLATAGTNAEGYTDVLRRMGEYHGQMGEGFARTAETTAFQWQRLKATVAELAEIFGSMLLPGLNQIVSALTSFVGLIADVVHAVNALPGPVKTFLQVALAAFAVSGPVLLGIVVMTKAVQTLRQAYLLLAGTQFAAGLISQLSALRLAMSAATIPATVRGSAWLVTYLKDLAANIPIVSRLLTGLGAAWARIAAILNAPLTRGTMLRALIGELTAVGGLLGVVGRALAVFLNPWAAVTLGIGLAVKAMLDWANATDSAIGIVKNYAAAFGEGFRGIWLEVKNAIQTTKDVLEGFGQQLAENFPWLQRWSDKLGEYASNLKERVMRALSEVEAQQRKNIESARKYNDELERNIALRAAGGMPSVPPAAGMPQATPFAAPVISKEAQQAIAQTEGDLYKLRQELSRLYAQRIGRGELIPEGDKALLTFITQSVEAQGGARKFREQVEYARAALAEFKQTADFSAMVRDIKEMGVSGANLEDLANYYELDIRAARLLQQELQTTKAALSDQDKEVQKLTASMAKMTTMSMRGADVGPPNIKAYIDEYGKAIIDLGEKLSAAKIPMTEGFRQLFQAAVAQQAVKDFGKDAAEALDQQFDVIAKGLEGKRDQMNAAITTAFTDLGETAQRRLRRSMTPLEMEIYQIRQRLSAQLANLGKIGIGLDTSDFALRFLAEAGHEIDQLQQDHANALREMSDDWLTWGNIAKTSLMGLTNSFVAAFTGGGGIVGALKGSMTSLFSSIGEKLLSGPTGIGQKMATGVMNAFGSNIAGAFAAMLPGIGAALGPVVGMLSDKIFGWLTGADAKKAKQMRDQFLQQVGGLEALKKAAADAGISVERLLSTKKSKVVQKEIENITKALEEAKKKADEFKTKLSALSDTGGLMSRSMQQAFTSIKGEGVDEAKWQFLQSMVDKVATGFNKIGQNALYAFSSDQVKAMAAAMGDLDVAGADVVEKFYLITSIGQSGWQEITRNVGGSTFAFKELRDILVAGAKEGKPFAETISEIAKAGKGTLKDLEQALIAAGKSPTAITELLSKIGDRLKLIGPLAGAAFGAMLAKGSSVVEALAAIEPGLSGIEDMLKASGLQAEGFLGQMMGWRSIVGGNKELFETLSGVDDMLVGLHNSALLTQDSFAALGTLVTDAFSTLTGQGVAAEDALRMMGPQLQKLWELATDFGYALDETTQSLLDQAEAAGTVGDQFRSSQDRMIQALDQMNERLGQMVVLLGGTLPAAAETGARGVQAALNSVTPPNLRVPVDADVSQAQRTVTQMQTDYAQAPLTVSVQAATTSATQAIDALYATPPVIVPVETDVREATAQLAKVHTASITLDVQAETAQAVSDITNATAALSRLPAVPFDVNTEEGRKKLETIGQWLQDALAHPPELTVAVNEGGTGDVLARLKDGLLALKDGVALRIDADEAQDRIAALQASIRRLGIDVPDLSLQVDEQQPQAVFVRLRDMLAALTETPPLTVETTRAERALERVNEALRQMRSPELAVDADDTPFWDRIRDLTDALDEVPPLALQMDMTAIEDGTLAMEEALTTVRDLADVPVVLPVEADTARAERDLDDARRALANAAPWELVVETADGEAQIADLKTYLDEALGTVPPVTIAANTDQPRTLLQKLQAMLADLTQPTEIGLSSTQAEVVVDDLSRVLATLQSPDLNVTVEDKTARDAIDRVKKALVGIKSPEDLEIAFEDRWTLRAIERIQQALDALEAPALTVPVTYVPPESRHDQTTADSFAGQGGVDYEYPEGYARGTRGFVDFGRGRNVTLHGKEAVFTQPGLEHLLSQVAAQSGAVGAGVASGTDAPPIVIEVPVTLDGYEIARIVASRIPQVLKQRGVA